MRFGSFWRAAAGTPRIVPEAIARVRAWVNAALAPADGYTIAVNEIVCRDPGCPGVETVVLLMRAGQRTRAVKVGKAVEEVTEQDIREALLS